MKKFITVILFLCFWSVALKGQEMDFSASYSARTSNQASLYDYEWRVGLNSSYILWERENGIQYRGHALKMSNGKNWELDLFYREAKTIDSQSLRFFKRKNVLKYGGSLLGDEWDFTLVGFLGLEYSDFLRATLESNLNDRHLFVLDLKKEIPIAENLSLIPNYEYRASAVQRYFSFKTELAYRFKI